MNFLKLIFIFLCVILKIPYIFIEYSTLSLFHDFNSWRAINTHTHTEIYTCTHTCKHTSICTHIYVWVAYGVIEKIVAM